MRLKWKAQFAVYVAELVVFAAFLIFIPKEGLPIWLFILERCLRLAYCLLMYRAVKFYAIHRGKDDYMRLDESGDIILYLVGKFLDRRESETATDRSPRDESGEKDSYKE